MTTRNREFLALLPHNGVFIAPPSPKFSRATLQTEISGVRLEIINEDNTSAAIAFGSVNSPERKWASPQDLREIAAFLIDAANRLEK